MNLPNYKLPLNKFENGILISVVLYISGSLYSISFPNLLKAFPCHL